MWAPRELMDAISPTLAARERAAPRGVNGRRQGQLGAGQGELIAGELFMFVTS